jgi:IS5 family transposase
MELSQHQRKAVRLLRWDRQGTPLSRVAVAACRQKRKDERHPPAEQTKRWRLINRARSRTRARGEHAFRIVKQLWGFAKVRYRGLAKNLARAQTMFALANLYQFRRELLPTELRCGL